MLALSIRQPYAELILRGIKTVEYRTRPTRIIGRRFWIYASQKKALVAAPWHVRKLDNIVAPTSGLPAWMIELAEQVGIIEPGTILPTGVLVGSAVVERVTPADPSQPNRLFRWHLADVRRIASPRRPKRHPQPVWFQPF
jgi:hypothetical protein